MAVVTDIRDYADERGNVIVGVPKLCQNVRLNFSAKNCRVEIADGVSIQNCSIELSADNGLIRIGKQASVKSNMRVGLNSSILIGERLSSTGGGIFSAAEGTSVTIGDDCMFAVSIDIRSDHSHPIFDRRTGARVNKSKSLVIGNHVWLGPQALIYPGSNVGEGSVIGARSLVSGVIPPNCVAVGVPAKVTRRDIVWDKRHLAIHAPCMFDDIWTLPNPWQSQVPIADDPVEAQPINPRRWLQRVLAITGCAIAQFAALPALIEPLAAL